MMTVKQSRMAAGFGSLAALVVGVNFGVLTGGPFSPVVLVSLGLAFIGAMAWLVLVLTGISRESLHEGKSLYGLGAVFSSVIFLCICIIIYAIAQRPNKSWDLTQEGRRDLSPQTVQVLEMLDRDVSLVAFFIQVEDELVSIARDKTRRFLEQCARHTPHLKVEFLDPQVDRLRLEALNISHASAHGTLVMTCGVNQRVIMLSGANPRLEERDFTNALINVTRRSRPKIGFLTGHGQRSIDDGETGGSSMLRQLLEMESYEPERMAIRLSHPEIPPEYDVIVINGLGVGGMRSDLRPEEINALDAYIAQGGRLMVLLDPWNRVVPDGASEQLVPWLARRFGIIVGNDMALSAETQWTVEMAADLLPFNEVPHETDFMGSFHAGHPVTRHFEQRLDFNIVRTVSAAPQTPPDVITTEILRTPPNFYGETDIATLISDGRAVQTPDERQGPLPIAAAATVRTDFALDDSGQTRDARVLVVGNSAFASNEQMHLPGNLNFTLNAFAWLTESEDLIAIRPSGKEAAPIMLTSRDERMIVFVTVLLTVQGVAAAGFVAHGLRRKYQ